MYERLFVIDKVAVYCCENGQKESFDLKLVTSRMLSGSVVKGRILRCERPCFTLQKAIFCNVKGRLSLCKQRRPVWLLFVSCTA